MQSDTQQIALGLRQGDLAVLEALVEQYQYRLVRYLIYLLGRRDGTSPHELFTVGLLSLADTLLDLPLGTIVSELRVGADLAQALLWHAGPAGGILDATIAFERGDFTAQSLQPNPGPAAIAYREALRWANATLASVIQA